MIGRLKQQIFKYDKFSCCGSEVEQVVDVYKDIFIIQDCLQQDTFDKVRVNMDDPL